MARPTTTAARPAAQPAAKAAPAKSSTAVAVQKKPGALAVHEQVPEWARGLAGQGVENLGQGDIETPRIKLLQAVSEECELFDEAKQGLFWHSVADRAMGSSVRIVPLYVDIRAILWRPRWEGGGILARADDGQTWNPPNAEFTVRPMKDSKQTVTWRTMPSVAASRLLDWGSSNPDDPNSQPAATRMYNMAVALPDFPELGLGVVTLQRSSIGPAKKFMAKLKLANAPSFVFYYNMSAVRQEGQEGPFFNYDFQAAGMVQDEDEFLTYKQLYENFKRMGLNIKDLETTQDEGVVVNASAAPGGDGKATY